MITKKLTKDLPELADHTVKQNPINQFSEWYLPLLSSQIEMPDAVTLATAANDGTPSARLVLLKNFDENGFVFYTNYNSNKAKELEENPRACLVFYWKEVRRQVRIWGTVKKVTRGESEEYFKTRPYASQISAWASDQSSVIPNREYLEQRFNEFQNKYPDGNVPLPPNWGGYRLIPNKIEFWQGRENRLHDRIVYLKKDNHWEIRRLAP